MQERGSPATVRQAWIVRFELPCPFWVCGDLRRLPTLPGTIQRLLRTPSTEVASCAGAGREPCRRALELASLRLSLSPEPSTLNPKPSSQDKWKLYVLEFKGLGAYRHQCYKRLEGLLEGFASFRELALVCGKKVTIYKPPKQLHLRTSLHCFRLC